MKGLKATLMAITATVLLSLGSTAHAIDITGDITFGGTLNTALMPANLGSATVVYFNNPALVTFSDGAFAANGLGFGSLATFNTLDMAALPVNPLWSANGFSFELTAVVKDPSDATHLNLRGSGVMRRIGFTDTNYAWSFSADKTGKIGFSATNASVPEPTSLLLLGSGLVGLGLVRRKIARG